MPSADGNSGVAGKAWRRVVKSCSWEQISDTQRYKRMMANPFDTLLTFSFYSLFKSELQSHQGVK